MVGPRGINLPGQITGSFMSTDVSPVGGFLRQADGTITTFLADQVQGNFASPTAINLFGQITGSHKSADYNYNRRGFLRQPNGTIVTFDATGSPDTEASSINDLGQITGYYQDANLVLHGFVRSPH